MARFRNIKLGVSRQYQNIKTVSLRNVGQNRFKKLSKFLKFQLGNFNLTWSNEGKINTLLLHMTYTIKLLQEMKMLDKLILKNHFNYTILVK